jgi:hypothetical protein
VQHVGCLYADGQNSTLCPSAYFFYSFLKRPDRGQLRVHVNYLNVIFYRKLKASRIVVTPVKPMVEARMKVSVNLRV